jgi:hypothetical protein
MQQDLARIFYQRRTSLVHRLDLSAGDPETVSPISLPVAGIFAELLGERRA